MNLRLPLSLSLSSPYINTDQYPRLFCGLSHSAEDNTRLEFQKIAANTMRLAPLPMAATAAAQHLIHLTTSSQSPLPPPGGACIQHGSCKWRSPTSTATSTGALGALQAYAMVAIIFLLCALICALALHGAIRCYICCQPPHEQDPHHPSKHTGEATAAPIRPGPVEAFSPGMDMAGTGECAICLAEFVEGEEVQLMAECRHGFHAQCIERWLISHSSCPNCRRNCLAVNVDVENAAEAHVPAVPGQRHFWCWISGLLSGVFFFPPSCNQPLHREWHGGHSDPSYPC